MKKKSMRNLCTAPAGTEAVLQGNIAFALGCVRAGIHSADGYPGTPSTEVIDRGLSQVQDLINVGWSVNEAVAVSVAFGHTLAGRDAVVTMKIPGLFQAGDIFTSASFFHEARGVLIYYIASDFTPSSTQHLVDPRYLFKSCALPVLEPAGHQQMLEAASEAVKLGRRFNTPVVILASGALCHSEGLVRLNPIEKRDPVEMGTDLKYFNCLPNMARENYNSVMQTRMPFLQEAVEISGFNQWVRGGGHTGVITYGAGTLYLKEVIKTFGADVDILSLAYTHPLPGNLIRRFRETISGDVYVIEDGRHFVQDELAAEGIAVIGKEVYSNKTEYSPTDIARILGLGCADERPAACDIAPPPRPPMICAGCPYRLFAGEVARLKKKGKLLHAFGDIGCNALLYFMDAMDTGLAMGASEAKRTGYVLSRPDMADKCISILGDSTECHSGLDATRNTVFRGAAGVKIVLDNLYTAMTGGQPAPTSPANLAGEPLDFDIVKALAATGTKTVEVSAYDRNALRKTLKQALAEAAEGVFTTIVVRGTCIKKVPNAKKGVQLRINADKCRKCHICLICPGIEAGPGEMPRFNHLCSGCGGETQACRQMCPFDAMEPSAADEDIKADVQRFDDPPEIEAVEPAVADLPSRLTLAIRGIGGQGNLFFGRVLTRLAFLAGYGKKNIVKGETHGMAQMGGPVISTFSCGDVFSPVLMPKTADCLIVMEMSEMLRPGFFELLKPGGIILTANTMIIPPAITAEQYPTAEQIKAAAEDARIVAVDVLGRAQEMGDTTGRSANVVMMGALSKIRPFDGISENIWLRALKEVTPAGALWAANYQAFKKGRELISANNR